LNDASLTLTPPAGNAKVVAISISSDTVQNLSLQSADSLSGVIYGAGGTPLPNVKVNLVPAGGSTNGNNTVLASTITDGQGRYGFDVAPGNYKLNLEHYGAAWGGVTLPTAEPNTRWRAYSLGAVTVAGDTTNNVQLPFVRLSGQIVDASGGSAANVALKSVWNFWSWTDSSNISHSVFIDGESTATSDTNGNYSIVVHLNDASLTLTPPAGSDMNAKVVAINISSDTVQNLSLQSDDSLSGVVYGAGGTPLPNVSVSLLQTYGGAVLATMKTNAQGHYGFGVAPGSYILNLEHYGAAWGGVMLPAAEPSRYWRAFGIGAASVAGKTVGSVYLPFVTLSAKATDANGVAVGNVKINNTLSSSSISIDGESSSISDVDGNASIVVVQAADEIAINPPDRSGFGITNLSGLNVTANKSINIVLPFKDVVAPVILSGPTIRAISATSAVIEWQTNEPSRGTVKVGAITATAANLSTTQSILITGLSASTEYTTEVSATDASGNGPTTKSASFITATAPDTAAPVILEGPTITASTNTTLVVQWTTSEPAKGELSYGTAGLSSSVTETAFTTEHRIELAALTANTQYQVQVNATDAAGNGPTLSRIATGRTLPTPDTSAPVITNGPLVSDITDGTATVTWKTDEPSTGGVSWNDGTAYGVLTDAVLSTEHRAQITGLAASTGYHLTVSSTDALGNGPSLSKTVDFSTLALADTTPPEILGTSTIVTITHQSAVIRWDTDEPADGQVSYGILSLDHNESRTALIKKHTVPLVGLTPATTYQFKVSAKDAAGNTSSSTAIYTFTTLADPDKKIPVFDTPPAVGYATDKQAVLKWKTDKQTDSKVTVTSITFDEPPKIKSQGKFNDEHEVSLTGLTPGNTYSVLVTSTDSEGNQVTQSLGNFSTPPTPDSLAPVITAAPSAQSIGATSVTLTWNTDKLSNSIVKYGTSGVALGQSAGDISYTTQHSVVLTKLKHSTAYQFQVGSSDPSGNSVQSTVISFSTAAKADTTAPSLSAASVSNITASTATITWTSDEPSSSSISYGTTALNQRSEDTALVSNHSLTLTGLNASTSYNFTISASDASGNKASSAATQSFETTAPQVLTLSSIAITGAASVDAGASATYSADATYSDNSTTMIAPVWTITGTGASVHASTGQLTADSVTTLQTVTLTASYQGQSAQKSIEIRPLTAGQTPMTYSASLPDGWTLAANGLATAIDVAATFGATGVADKVTTVWAWDATNSIWNFYSPVLSATQLADYAASKGYQVLSSIAPRQGYWVNASVPVDMAARTGVPVTLAASDLITGWNLVGLGLQTTPSDLNRALSGAAAGSTPSNFTSLWAWDNLNGAWYFYAPSLEVQGGTVLKDYIDNKGYLDFITRNKTLNLDSGFWVNKP
jgi:chitodextrinase